LEKYWYLPFGVTGLPSNGTKMNALALQEGAFFWKIAQKSSVIGFWCLQKSGFRVCPYVE
jgi:hypothetical protein